MDDRIDRRLRGELPPGALTPGERADAEALERVIAESRALVEGSPEPDVTEAVMRRVAGLPPPARRRAGLAGLAGAWWAPRQVSFRVRPVYGLLAGAAAVALAVAWPASPPPTPAPPQMYVQFHLEAPDASTVRLAGTFTDWEPRHALYQSAPGTWTITVALAPGVHDYAFVIDGQRWTPDPHAPAVDDGFGGHNSRLALLPPDTPRS